MRRERRNLYRLLHVQPEAPPEVIKAAWRALMSTLRAHPDLDDAAVAAFVDGVSQGSWSEAQVAAMAMAILRFNCIQPGLDPAESEQLLDELLEFACQAPRTYEHQWSVGDVIVWDNRAVLHRATYYDAVKYKRFMQRTTIGGDTPTVLQ